ARPVERSALLGALAMEGAWDAWRWTPIGVGVFLPARLTKRHHLRHWPARLDIEAAVALTSGWQGDDTTIAEPDPGQLVQAALDYSVLCLPWLSAGTTLQVVAMPSAPRFRAQTAVRPALAAAFGRWRLGT